MSPYGILGLAEDESDERTIKRAYARLLKQHRPDQDPDGFTRIHNAYQRVLAWRERRPEPIAVALTESPHLQPDVVPAMPPEVGSPAALPIRPSGTVSQMVLGQDLWSQAVRELARVGSVADEGERQRLRRTAVEELTALRRQGLGSDDEWRTLVRDACGGRWRTIAATLDDLSGERLVGPMAMPELHEAFKELAKSATAEDMLRVVEWWLSAVEHQGSLAHGDGAIVLRWMSWLVLLDVSAAMRLVALAERSPIARKTVNQADRLLAAGPEARKLPEPLRWFLIGRILGTQPRHLRDPRIDEVFELTCLLSVEHPLRALLMGPAGIRPKYQTKAAAGSGLDPAAILMRFPNVLFFFAIFAFANELKPWLGGWEVALGWVAVIAWWRHAATVQRWLLGGFSEPPRMTTGWAMTWFSWIGIGFPLLTWKAPDGLRWGCWVVATLGFMWAYSLLRSFLVRSVGESGWRSMVPCWQPLSDGPKPKIPLAVRRLALVGAWVWTSVLICPMFEFAPFDQPNVPIAMSLVWLSGPATLSVLTIRAWLIAWLAHGDPRAGSILYWVTWTLCWCVGLWWCSQRAEIDALGDGQAVAAAAVFILAALIAVMVRLLFVVRRSN